MSGGRKHRLQDMTCAEFAERATEKPVVLLPFGAQEQQGPHAPMGDFMLADRLAALAAERSGAVAAPTMPFGESESVRGMPGCISLRPPTLVALIEDICDNFLDHGLEHLVILNGQTSNGPHIDHAVRRLRRKRGVMVPRLDLWRLTTPEQRAKLYGADAARAQGHGGDPITSMFMHHFPDIVRGDLVAPPPGWKTLWDLPTKSVSTVIFRDVPVPLPLDVTEMSTTGTFSGDPRYASAEIGRGLTQLLVDFIVAFVEHFRGCDVRAPAR